MTDDSKNKPARTIDGSVLVTNGSSKTTQSVPTEAVKRPPPPKSTK